jgi:hypothetical protein
VVIIRRMSDDKPKPVDDLKEGLNLLFRAAKGAVEKLPTDKLEDVAKDAAKEVSRAFESIGNEIDKAFGKTTGSAPPPQGHAPPPPEAKSDDKAKEKAEAPKEEPRYDDGYAPDPPKGPRIG